MASGPGEVLVRMKAVGLCRSDLDMVDSHPGSAPYANSIPQGYTLGHENAGVVEELGVGVRDLKKGEAVVNSTERPSSVMPCGCGFDGGLAEFMVVPRAELVSIGDQDPVYFAPLTDAGVTAYHAVQTIIGRLRPGTSAAVIGVGGLRAYGLQFIKHLSQARIFALDISPERLKLAKELGAHEVVSSDDKAADTILELTGGRGVEGIIDLVGSDRLSPWPWQRTYLDPGDTSFWSGCRTAPLPWDGV
ncbi:hypothetical protein VTN00DRAFT_9981 [Thermoascus crustaceus]|uniref:uncharacterized protein n=1 Tax=Thermoascus crustaceus TaxID=5088 RepID=UPI003742FB29